MDSRQPAAADASLSQFQSQPTPRDAPCKVAFVDVSVAKATPRTSCRSTASSDSGESVTSLTPTMTSSSRDSDDDDDDEVAPSSSTTWSTYIYFYPRHDMTFTHCLLTSSRQIDCDDPSATYAAAACCWPRLPGRDIIAAGGSRRGRETVSTGGAGGRCWRRRVNAARTPFWFPAARSYNAAAPAYFYYPRHDLSYAEVEVSRVDRQPGVDQSSLPFNTILEELADDADSLDDWPCELEDRKSVDDNDSDVRSSQLPFRAARDDAHSNTSSLSACRSEEEPMHGALSPQTPQIRTDSEMMTVTDDVSGECSGCASTSVSITGHKITSSDRKVSPRGQAADAILTPITKLDLRGLQVATTPRPRVDSGRTRVTARSPVAADKTRLGTRRCVSDPAVRSRAQQSPVRELPHSATVARRNRNQFCAAGEEVVDDGTTDGERACWSPRSTTVPLRAKHAVTCLLAERQPSSSFNAARSSRRDRTSLGVADAVVSNNDDDATVSRHNGQFSTDNFVVTSTPPAAATDDRPHASNSDQTENNVEIENESLGRTVGVTSTLPDDVTWNAAAEMTSPDVTSLAMVGWSSSSSEYLTPPTRRDPSETERTASVTASSAGSKVCDADRLGGCAEVHTAHLTHPDDGKLVTASATFTRLCDAAPPRLYTDVRSAEVQAARVSRVEQETSLTSNATVCETVNAGLQCTEVQPMLPSHLRERSVVASSPTISVTRVRDSTSTVPESDDVSCPEITYPCSEEYIAASATATSPAVNNTSMSTDVQSAHPSRLEHCNMVTSSPTITLVSDAVSPTIRIIVPTREIRAAAHRSAPGSNELAAANSTRTRFCGGTSSTVDTDVCYAELHRRGRELTGPGGIEKNRQHAADSRLKYGNTRRVVIQDDRRRSSAAVRSPDLPANRSFNRPSTAVVRESTTAPSRRRRAHIERIGADSLVNVGGQAATPAPRHQDAAASRPAPVDHKAASRRRIPPSKSYVNIWRKRVATYEAFVNRCQPTGARCHQGAQYRH